MIILKGPGPKTGEVLKEIPPGFIRTTLKDPVDKSEYEVACEGTYALFGSPEWCRTALRLAKEAVRRAHALGTHAKRVAELGPYQE